MVTWDPTWVSVKARVGIVALFIAWLLTPALLERASAGTSIGEVFLKDLRSVGLQLALDRIDGHLIADSVFARGARPLYQRFLTTEFRQGSERVIVGRDGWLFFRDDYDFSNWRGAVGPPRSPQPLDVPPRRDVLDIALKSVLSVTGVRRELPPPTPRGPWLVDPIESIVDFRRQLAARDIRLVVVLVPVKTAIYPDRLWPRWRAADGPAMPAGYRDWVRRLGDAGVEAVDLTDVFWSRRQMPGSGDLFLEHDTHWSAAGVALAADSIAPTIASSLNGLPREVFSSQPVHLARGPRDLIDLLELPDSAVRDAAGGVDVRQVTEDGSPVPSGEDDAPVLLFGDSMTATFDRPERPELGVGAGLAAHLALRTGQRVQWIAQPGGGSEMIARTLGARPEMLNQKRVVIWQLVTRGIVNPKLYSLISVPSRQGGS